LIQVGRQAMADRYAYQSILGLFIMVCWGLSDLAKEKQLPKLLLPALSVIVLAALSVVTYRQIGYWQDNLTLWSHALQVTDKNWVAEDMVAGMLQSQGHRDEAIQHYRNVAAIVPDDAGSNLAIAIYEQNHGNQLEAIKRYKRAIAGMDDPLEKAKAYQNMGVAYRDLGDQQEAGECFNKAAALRRQNLSR
jgi:protein O-mannosyl-transferase